MLLTPPKSELHIWFEKWFFNIVTAREIQDISLFIPLPFFIKTSGFDSHRHKLVWIIFLALLFNFPSLTQRTWTHFSKQSVVQKAAFSGYMKKAGVLQKEKDTLPIYFFPHSFFFPQKEKKR